MFMDDIELFAQKEDQIDSLVNTVRVFQMTSKWKLVYQSVVY